MQRTCFTFLRLGISCTECTLHCIGEVYYVHGRLILRIIACSGKWTFLYTEVWITLVELNCFYDKNYFLFHIVLCIELLNSMFIRFFKKKKMQLTAKFKNSPQNKFWLEFCSHCDLNSRVSWLQLLRFGGVIFCMCIRPERALAQK